MAPTPLPAGGRILLALSLVLLCVVGRLAPHPPNFTPMAAAAMLGGYYLGHRWLVLLVPPLAMLLSDLLLGGYDLRIMACVYGAMLVPAMLGRLIRGNMLPLRLLGVATASSVIFFLISNLAVWLFAGYYESTWAGLAECYAAAIPFFKFTWLGDLFWSVALFGCVALAHATWSPVSPAPLAPAKGGRV